ncbi:MAG: hypothetical protein KGI94_03590 [Paracoccaceae bacterium]|nr:hypothetical protein [Paracoccaceae bacterium]MDE3122508.1 hypothetical protein [Paracoccaceae bacterium]MDE3238064.1 hypothetical protein [Paracoccaceae bacterium]
MTDAEGRQRGTCRARVGAFIRQQDGVVAVATVIWLPIFIVILWLMSEAALAFSGETQIRQVIEDANRLYATGYIQTAADTQNYILGRFPNWSSSMTVTTTESNKIIQTVVTIPLTTVTGINAIQQFSGITLTISGEQMSEG